MSHELRILSYNIFMRPYLIKNNANDHKETRLRLIAEKMVDFDIICFQESFDIFTHRRQKLLSKAHENGFRFFATSPSPSFLMSALIDCGLVILSKFPIVQSEFKVFSQGVHSDSLAKKGILFVRIIVNGHYVNLFTTHTQASYVSINPNDAKPSCLKRVKQLFELKKFVDEMLGKVAGPQDLNLLMGDFNVDALDTEYPYEFVMSKLDPIIASTIKPIYRNEYDFLFFAMNPPGSRFFAKDICLEVYKKHITTYGSIEIPETVLTSKEDQLKPQSLDHIFQIFDHLAGPNTQIKLTGFHVEPFLVNQKKITQLSDHHGLASNFLLSSSLAPSSNFAPEIVPSNILQSPSEFIPPPYYLVPQSSQLPMVPGAIAPPIDSSQQAQKQLITYPSMNIITSEAQAGDLETFSPMQLIMQDKVLTSPIEEPKQSWFFLGSASRQSQQRSNDAYVEL